MIEEHWVRASFWHFLICLDWLKKYCKGAHKRKYEKEKIRKVKYHPSSKYHLNTQFFHIKKDFDSSMNSVLVLRIVSIIVLFITIWNEARKKYGNLIDSLLMYIMQNPIPILHQELFMGSKLSFSPFYLSSHIIYYFLKIDLLKLHLDFPLKLECQKSFIAHWKI